MNVKKITKWALLVFGCLIVAALCFVSARYVASGAEYEGDLESLAPGDVSIVVQIDDLPTSYAQFSDFLDGLEGSEGFAALEASRFYREMTKSLPGAAGGLAGVRAEVIEPGLATAERSASEAGLALFEDVLGGKMLLCADVGEDGLEFAALTRVSRKTRFRWQFLDIASGFFPSGIGKPRITFEDGVLSITPAQSISDEVVDARKTFRVALFDDVLVVSDSPRLLNATLEAHKSGGGLGANEAWSASLQKLSDGTAEQETCRIWLDLDRLRQRMEPEVVEGTKVSPIDNINTLPPTVIGIYADIFAPLNRILERDMDMRPFRAAWIRLSLEDASEVVVDQHLIADPARIDSPAFSYLLDTFKLAPAEPTQLDLLPADTMFQVSYRQPMEVVYRDVMDESARASFVGDFVVSMQGKGAEEVVFAAVPRHYAPNTTLPVSGTDLPLPGFALAFRVPGAEPELASRMLQEYLNAQRGRRSDALNQPTSGPVIVTAYIIAGKTVYGFLDRRPGDDFIKRLNTAIRAVVIGDWLILSNSEKLVETALVGGNNARDGREWSRLHGKAGATVFVAPESFTEYADEAGIFGILRGNRYNHGLIEGRDPGEVRRSIATSLGLDPNSQESLIDKRVADEYERRKEAWLTKCAIEGPRYEQELEANFRGLSFVRRLALTTRFEADHLHTRTILTLR